MEALKRGRGVGSVSFPFSFLFFLFFSFVCDHGGKEGFVVALTGLEERLGSG